MQDIEDLKPREPGPSECCGSGCARCVWDVYFDAYATWEARRAVGGAVEEPAPPPSTAFSRPEPGPGGCGSYLGSVVLKYVDYEGEEDDFGVVCPSDAVKPVWRETIIGGPLVVTPAGATRPAMTDEPGLELLELTAPTPLHFADASTYTPGDVLELFVPNDSATVSSLCKHFRLPETRLVQLKRSPFVDADCFPPWIPQRRNITVRDLFTYYIDVSSSAYVRKPFLSLLQKCVAEQHSSQRSSLQQLAEQHKVLQAEVSTTFPSLVDMLDTYGQYFNASGLPLAKFLEVSAPLRSRKFSIIDFRPSDGSLRICARQIKSIRTSATPPDAAAARLIPAAAMSTPFQGHVSRSLFLHHRQSNPTHFAASLWLRHVSFGHSLIPKAFAARPLLMLCGGSGIGPALSVLVAAHHAHRQQNGGSTTPSTIPRWLFFSSRSHEEAMHILGAFSETGAAVRATCSRVVVNITRPIARSTQSAQLSPGGTLEDSSSEIIQFEQGRIDSVMMTEAHNIGRFFHGSQAAVLACGPSGFLTSVRQTLASVLFPPDNGDDSSVSEHQLAMSEMTGNIVFEDWNQRK